MTGFSTTPDGKSSDFDFEPRPVFLDPGTIKSRLTLDMRLHLIETMKVSLDEHMGAVVSFKYEVGGVTYCKVSYFDDATNIVLSDDFLQSAYVVYDWEDMEISLAQFNSEEAEDDIHEIVRDVPGGSAATDIPRGYLGYDKAVQAAPTESPLGVPTITLTALSTASGSGSVDTTDTCSSPTLRQPNLVTVKAMERRASAEKSSINMPYFLLMDLA
ncbi:aspartic ase 3 [Fusarium beomiforme]|uniref:Aspartic ase 3 n=1 Tax=Fusarium beomiforme TaxID=44412 RepID=A0A9P5ANS1_9HYPO|nr:aspartic ase 3 [Fusarium beomiforme]